MTSTLLDFFPTPRYLAPPALGLDISDEGIKFVELVRTRGGIKLGRFGERPLSPGVLVNGKIVKSESLTDALSSLHKELRLRVAALSIMEGQGYLMRLKVPVREEALIRQGIELQLEEHIPLPPGDVLFDYEIVASPLNTNDYYEVGVSVFPTAVIESYFDAVSGGGFDPFAIEVESQSLARSVVPRDEKDTSMIVDIGKSRTSIAVSSEGLVAFTSTISLGGDNFTRAIQKELGLDKEAAEEMKAKEGISRSGSGRKLLPYFVPVLAALREEIGNRYTYWNTHIHESGAERRPIEKIVLCGGAAKLDGLAGYLASTLEVPVSTANPWQNSFFSGESMAGMKQSDSLAYATAIGLALRSFDASGSMVFEV